MKYPLPLRAGCVMAAFAFLVACTEKPPASNAAAASKPDLTGWWLWELPLNRLPSPFVDAPFKPELAGAMRGMSAAYDAAVLPDPVALGAKPEYCQLPFYSGFNGGFENAVEFLPTEGRLTITNESGMIRRIALGSGSLPAEVDASRLGTSVGHWEGSTLVIETAGLRADNPVYLTPFKLGEGAHVLERITQTGPDTLQIAMTMTAPALFAKPFELQLVYKRDRMHQYHEYSVCEQDDRSIDPKTGRQRFDLTPPPDLPPPPGG
jgi:hypothetical protein